MQRRKRERPQLQALELSVTVSPGDSSTKLALFEAMVHHLLYIRGQIAAPFRQLVQALSAHDREQAAQAQAQPSPGSRAREAQFRKLRAFVDDVTSSLAALEVVCAGDEGSPQQVIASLSLLMGSSASTPKEMATLHFDCSGSGSSNSSNVNSNSLDSLRRKLVRELITYSPFDDADVAADGGPTANSDASGVKPPPPTSIFFSVALRGGGAAVMPAGAEVYGRREGFRPLLRRNSAAPLCVWVGSQPAVADTSTGSVGEGEAGGTGEEAGMDVENGEVVFVLKRGVRALRKSVSTVL